MKREACWGIGVLGYWDIGVLERCLSSSTPLLQYRSTPTLHPRTRQSKCVSHIMPEKASSQGKQQNNDRSADTRGYAEKN